jgi:uncharacterized membrane protein HdeD (DUF308 family)
MTMSTTYDTPPAAGPRQERAAPGRDWLWFVVLGFGLVILGCMAVGFPWIAGLATALVIGALLLVAGLIHLGGAIWCRGWGGFFLHLLSGVLLIALGLLFVRAPGGAVLALTLLLAFQLMVGGIFQIGAALTYRFEAWGWLLVTGILDLILSLLIWLEWPASALWVIGLFAGISLIFHGFTSINLGLAFRTRPPRAGDRSAARAKSLTSDIGGEA